MVFDRICMNLSLKMLPVSWLLIQMEVGMQCDVSHGILDEVLPPVR